MAKYFNEVIPRFSLQNVPQGVLVRHGGTKEKQVNINGLLYDLKQRSLANGTKLKDLLT